MSKGALSELYLVLVKVTLNLLAEKLESGELSQGEAAEMLRDCAGVVRNAGGGEDE